MDEFSFVIRGFFNVKRSVFIDLGMEERNQRNYELSSVIKGVVFIVEKSAFIEYRGRVFQC